MSETPIWPFVFRDDAHAERVTMLLSASKVSRQRVERYVASPAHQRRMMHLSRLQREVTELENDLYEAERDYCHLSLFNDLVISVEPQGVDFLDVLTAYVAMILIDSTDQWKEVNECDYRVHMYLDQECRQEFPSRVRQRLRPYSCPSSYRKKDYCLGSAGTIEGCILNHASDAQLMYLTDGNMDEIFFDMLSGKTGFDPVVIGGIIQNLKLRVEALRKLYWEKSGQLKVLNDKMQSVSDNLYGDPETVGGDENAERVVHTLYILLVIDAQVSLGLWPECAVADAAKNLMEDAGVLANMAMDPLFWYLTFFLIFEVGFGVEDEDFDPEFSELLAQLFRSPAKIGRIKCSRKYDKVKSSLKHFIAPVLCDIELQGRGVCMGESDTQRGPSEFNLRSHLLAGLMRKPGDTGLSRKQEQAIRRILKEIIIPARHSIMDRLEEVHCDDEIMASMPTISGWLQEFDADEEDDMPDDDLLEDTPEISSEPEERVWRYVDNPVSGLNAYTEWRFRSGAELDAHFRKHHVRSSIKAESIIRSLDYYHSMDTDQKNIMIKEQVGSESWHKLKRGGMRILIRKDEDRNIYVHVYPRKEWKYMAA